MRDGTSRTIVREFGAGTGMTDRVDAGHADELRTGELELHINPQQANERGRLLVEAPERRADAGQRRIDLDPWCRFKISHQAQRMLRELTETGLYGETIQDTARELLLIQLRQEEARLAQLPSIEIQVEPVKMCKCGLAIYDDAAKAGICGDCAERDRFAAAAERRRKRKERPTKRSRRR